MLFRCSERCCEMTSNAGRATTMDGYPVRASTKAMSLNANEERWRGTICEYDCGDDHPNNVIGYAAKVTFVRIKPFRRVMKSWAMFSPR